MPVHKTPDEQEINLPATTGAPLTREQIQICITRKEEMLNGTVKGIDRMELHTLVRDTRKKTV